MEKEQKIEIIRIISASVLLAAALVCEHVIHTHPVSYMVFCVAAFAVSGFEVMAEAVRNIIKLNPLDECFLMTVAGVGAFFTGSGTEAAMIMILYCIGEFLQDLAVDKSRDSIEALIDVTPAKADVLRDGVIVEIDPKEIAVGDITVVKCGRRIPADGTVISGTSLIDTSAVTGEPVPVAVSAGDKVISGSVNTGAEITVRADAAYAESTAAKMTALIKEAECRKARTEAFISSFARIYTPAIVAAALLLGTVPPLFDGMWSEWIHKALMLLVISCPCALVISVPLTFFAGIGACSKRGILTKGGEYIEALADVGIFAFDKTGTLTCGKFEVTEICPTDDKDELLKTACAAERHSDHPIAKAVAALGCEGYDAEDVTETAGEGVECTVNGEKAAAGGIKLMRKLGFEPEDKSGAVHVVRGGKYLGYITVADKVRPQAASAVAALKADGVQKTVMLTGDGKENAEKVAEQTGIDEVCAGLLPQDKLGAVEKLISRGKTAYAGDGINDAAVLARADVGVAMGGIGSDIAIEAADIVITDDDIGKLPTARRIAKKTVRIAKENIIFALSVKFIILMLSLFGITGMWLAVIADTGVTLLAAANSMRVLK